jgi:hypothetical protein
MEEDEMGGTCRIYAGEVHIVFRVNMKGERHYKYKAGGRALKSWLKRQDGRVLNGVIWLRTGTTGGLL